MHNNISDAESFFETASKEELIDYLVKTIEKEVSKGDDADCDLVRECSDWLDELTEDEVTFTPEELERKLAQLKAGSELKKPVKIRKKAKLKTFVRVALIAAVIFTISLVSLSAVAMNKGYDSTLNYVVSNIEKILGLAFSEKMYDSGITIINNKTRKCYESMDELIEEENLSILHPASMPDNIRITQINMIHQTEEKYTLFFSFSSDSYKLTLTNYYTIDVANLKGFECVSANIFEYYIIQKDTNDFLALFQYKGFEYIIQSPSYDDLYKMVNSMKG
ncbi:MAG: hypothetical protein IJB43_00460 [Clostridia bacterium]|nr:hypothetical protein [Clostridia bacterium]